MNQNKARLNRILKPVKWASRNPVSLCYPLLEIRRPGEIVEMKTHFNVDIHGKKLYFCFAIYEVF